MNMNDIAALMYEKRDEVLILLMGIGIGVMIGILLALHLGVIRYECAENNANIIVDNFSRVGY